MKKSIIAAGAASVALAAMPVLGVFASVTDTLTAYVGNGCNVSEAPRTSTATFGTDTTSGRLTPGGADQTQSTGAFTFTCNAGWTMDITGNNLTGTGVTPIGSDAANAKGSWYKLALALDTGGSSVEITNPYSGTSAPAFISGSVTSASAVTNLSVTPSYTIHIGEAQEPGTYTGTVVYNIGIIGA